MGRPRKQCGHPLEGDNVYVQPDGVRRCRECQRQRYREWKKRNGIPDRDRPGAPDGTIEQILARLVIQSDGCWLWPGCKNKLGYGIVERHRKKLRVHRLVYEHYRGEIAEGLVLHHTCKRAACANPAHLEPCTVTENIEKDQPGFWSTERRRATALAIWQRKRGEEPDG